MNATISTWKAAITVYTGNKHARKSMIASPLSLSLSLSTPSPCPSTHLSHGLIQALDNIVVNHWPRTSLWTGPVIETINSDRTVYFDRLQRWRIGLNITEFGKNLRCKFYRYLGRGESRMNEFLLIIFFSEDFSDCSMLLDFKLNIIITW